MKNKFGWVCHRCGAYVAKGSGHFESYKGGWRTLHASCAIEERSADKP